MWTQQDVSSNRTFMELKFEKKSAKVHQFERSNRTFMELKYNKLRELAKEKTKVLIVPLWN